MKKFALIVFACCSLLACEKEDGKHACYDESLVHDLDCTFDCPGFEGCDGNTYCNSCEAARVGIGPKEDDPK